MKYERMKNNAPVDIDTIREQDRKVGNALSYAIDTGRYQCILAFEKEASKFMKTAGVPEREMRNQISKYSTKLRHAILGVRDEVGRAFAR